MTTTTTTTMMSSQSTPRRCKRSRSNPTSNNNNNNNNNTTRHGRFSFRHALLASCLLLHNVSEMNNLAAQAFVTETHPTSNGNRWTRQSHSPFPQQPQQYSSSALHFFFNSDDGSNRDLPLARYVDVSANYTLAHTPEDYIDLQENQRLVCVGDVHGDLQALRQFLQVAGVYDPSSDSWCGGNTIVVQCGDILDRGLEELACYRLLSKLSQQALAQNGKVILLVGNHEALNAMGLFQYAFTDHEHEVCIGSQVDATLGPENLWRKQYANNQPARWASYEPGGLLAHSLLRNMKVAVRVGKTLCVHAGMSPQHLKEYGGIDQMNEQYREWISLGDDLSQDASNSQVKPVLPDNPVIYNHNGNYPTPRQPWIDAEQRQQYYINSIPPFLQSNPQDPGPIWMRDYSTPHDAPPRPQDVPKLEQELDTTLTLVDAHRMVMGHTIQQRINGILGGKAWRLDVGASKGCLNGTPEVLEVVCHRSNTDEASTLTETVSVLSWGSRSSKIPAKERLVDAYTKAAVELL